MLEVSGNHKLARPLLPSQADGSAVAKPISKHTRKGK